MHVGPIPDGKMVLHKCDVPYCINPEHLYIGDAKQNILDCISRGRWKPIPGALHGKRKLTWDSVKKMRGFFISGFPIRKIASEFRMSVHATYSALRNITWHDPDYSPPPINSKRSEAQLTRGLQVVQ